MITIIKKITIFLILFFVSKFFAQEESQLNKINVSGKIIEKSTSLPLEYATVTFFKENNPKPISGGITNNKGEFTVTIPPGIYNIKYEFISFKTIEVKQKSLTSNTNLGNIYLEDAAQQLQTVEIRAEKTTVDIKLDKKIYAVGKDIMVRGGTVSDVLDNVPSVSVDAEGVVSLRGNENVRILIDGKPSSAVNVNDALKLLSADAIDKVEVVTNPSARYDAEGGGGIINIILKKGRNQGINGSVIVSAGSPQNTSGSANINVKKTLFNLFTTVGYNKRNNVSRIKIDQENFDKNRVFQSFVQERRQNEKLGEGGNFNFGIELPLNKSTSWTNAVTYRKNNVVNGFEYVTYYNYDNNRNFVNTRVRNSDIGGLNENVEYTSNFIKKFKKEGHKLTIDGAFAQEKENEDYLIQGNFVETGTFVSYETTHKKNTQTRNLIQADYVLPINQNSQFEAGFRGNYVNLLSDYQVQEKKNSIKPFN